MKQLIFTTCVAFLFTITLRAQEPIFKRGGDRKIEGLKLLKKMNDASVIQTSIYFQNVTKRSIYVTEKNALGGVLGGYAGSKSGGNAASADLIAYLVFSDGEPNDTDYQKVTDEFYTYFNTKLLQAGIETVSWENFTSSKYFSKIKDEKDDEKTSQELKKKGNAWKIYIANNGPHPIRYNPVNHNYNVPAVKGTVQMSNYGKEVKTGTLLALNLVLDFADIFLEGDANSGKTERTFSTVEWKKSTVKYSVSPQLRVTNRHNGGNQVFVFDTKGKKFEEIYNVSDVYASKTIKASVEQDPSKIKRSKFLSSLPSMAQKHEIDPFVVEVTKAEYFENVKSALEQYADKLVKTIVKVKNQ